jgi:hypothetical protein
MTRREAQATIDRLGPALRRGVKVSSPEYGEWQAAVSELMYREEMADMAEEYLEYADSRGE